MAGEIIARFQFEDFQRGEDAGKGVFKPRGGKQWVTYEMVQQYLAKRFDDVVSLMSEGEHLEITITAMMPEASE